MGISDNMICKRLCIEVDEDVACSKLHDDDDLFRTKRYSTHRET